MRTSRTSSTLLGLGLIIATALCLPACAIDEGAGDAVEESSASSESAITVSNASQFLQALARANPGDTITVASGADLGRVNIDGKKYPRLAAKGSKVITIRSSSPNRPAAFQGLVATNVRNLRIDGLRFESNTSTKAPFLIEQSENIQVVNSVVQGQRVQGDGAGNGLFFEKVDNLTVSNNEFLDLHTSVSISGSSNVTVSENQLLRGSYDTLHFGTVKNLKVLNNTIRAQPTSTVKHVDLMQFINMSGGSPTENVVVRNNDIRSTNDVGIHGIYFGNHDAQANAGRRAADYYKNIVIEDNHIESTQMAAIAVSYAKGVTIRGNVARRPTDAPKETRTISLPTILVEVDNTDVEITGNQTATPPRAGHLITGWHSEAIPKSWDVNDNGPAK